MEICPFQNFTIAKIFQAATLMGAWKMFAPGFVSRPSIEYNFELIL